MSARAARGFLPALREVERGLAAPLPDRVRILTELEADLEALRDRLVADGLDPAEARRRALEALVPSPEALGELDRLHRTIYARVTAHVDEERLRLAERRALVVATGVVLLGEALTLLRVDLLSDPSPFLWPVLGLGALLSAVVLAKVFQLWVKGDHSAPARGLGAILGLSGTILGVGFGGVLLDLYAMAGAVEGDPDHLGRIATEWLMRDAALLSVTLLLALAGGLTWFVLRHWLTFVTGAHRAALGLENDDNPQNPRGA